MLKMRSFFTEKAVVLAKWQLCAGLSIAAIVATYWLQAGEALRYDRELVLSGEIWRLASSHLVHLNTPHLIMNLLALLLLCELVWRNMEVPLGIGLLAFSALGVNALLLAFHPELAWYVGLSGALHGLWAGCALQEIWAGKPGAGESAGRRAQRLFSRRMACMAFGLLCFKLILEYLHGPSQRTELAIGGEVVTVSHAYGAFSGIAYILAWRGIALLRDVALPRFRLK